MRVTNRLSAGRIMLLSVLTSALCAGAWPLGASAQRRPIVITADQPNIWTLEQAHYLLAQMHRRNLDLKAAAVGELDANAINGVSVDALKTLLSVSAEFDQAVGTNNKLLRDEKVYSANRRQELLTRRARLEDESLALTRQIAELKIKKLRAGSDEEKAPIQAEIEELTIVHEVVKEQSNQTNEQLKALPAGAGAFESLNLEAPSTQAAGTYTSTFQETAKKVIEQFNNAPKLNASLRLDNYLQMQYEILSKQLTLLRDEIGPGERLIFMEIPQSINASHEKSDDKWAQSWWKISGYSQCVLYKESGAVVPCSKVLQELDRSEVPNKTSTSEVVDKIRHFDPEMEYTNYKRTLELTGDDIREDFVIESTFSVQETEFGRKLVAQFSEATQDLIAKYKAAPAPASLGDEAHKAMRADVTRVLNRFINNEILKDHKFGPANSFRRDNPILKFQHVLPTGSQIFRRLYIEQEFPWVKPLERFAQSVTSLDATGAADTVWGGAENRTIRVVDLFPRQSSLNVNDLKLRNSTYSFKFLFQLISGFGAGANYQREREQYSQFVQQELYSSAFGKGSREFGWTFNPMPGSKRLLSGVRTTYAIVIVPEDTSSIILESKGCYFPRSSAQPSSFGDTAWNGADLESRSGCMNPRKFIVPIPDGGGMNNNNFGVTEIKYKPVKKGGRAVVTIFGRNFSSQIGVLVEGVPLTQSLGLGQPFIRDDSTAGQAARTEVNAAKVKGSFERIGSNQIVATFEMESDYEGAPTITLVAPGKAADLNALDTVRVNDTYICKYCTYNNEWPYIFGKKVGSKEQEVSLDKVSAFVNEGKLSVIVTGKNLTLVKTLFVNGQPHDNPAFVAPASGAASTVRLPGAEPAPTYDPDSYRKHLISLRDLPPLPAEKTIQVTLLTPDGALNASPIENPAFRKENQTPDAVRYGLDETKLSVTAAPAFKRCEEAADKTITASYDITGIGFTEKTKAFVVDKEKEQEQDFVYEASTRGVLTIKNPGPRQTVVFRDADTKLRTQRVVVWRRPQDGCN